MCSRLAPVVGLERHPLPRRRGRVVASLRAEGVFDVEAGVPDVQDRHGGEFPHRGPVRRRGRSGDPAPFPGGQAVLAACHGRAGGQPLDVPLERAGQRLVGVVQVEGQPPLGEAEAPKFSR
jgi:hypothetical protein